MSTPVSSPLPANVIEESKALAAAEELINAKEAEQLNTVVEQSKELAAMRPQTTEEEVEALNRAVEESVIDQSKAHAAMLEAEVPKSEQDESTAVAQAQEESLAGEREVAEKLQASFNQEAEYQQALEMQEIEAVANAFETSTQTLQAYELPRDAHI